MKIDIMVTAPATGNINYINWVKQQTAIPEFEKNKKKELPAPALSISTKPDDSKDSTIVKKNEIAGADDKPVTATADFAKMD